jgi:riboflavin kinase/FMN adenylyltransferase
MMQRWWTLEEVPVQWGPTAVTIGKFNAIHVGHNEILRQLVELSEHRGLQPTVITFDRHPSKLLAPDKTPADILSITDRLNILEQQNVSAAIVLPFTQELASLSPRGFVTEVLLGRLHAQAVLVGHDFRFGQGASGDVTTLTELGKELGFDVVLIDDVAPENGVRASSSLIREHMADGDVAGAARLLGRFPRVTGEVVHGFKRGRELGFPTANMSQESVGLIPADGVYAGWFMDDGRRYACAISVGTNPTFEGVTQRTIEAFLLDQKIDLYGHQVSIDFVDHIRGMVAFDGLDALIEQMNKDVVRTREVLGLES